MYLNKMTAWSFKKHHKIAVLKHFFFFFHLFPFHHLLPFTQDFRKPWMFPPKWPRGKSSPQPLMLEGCALISGPRSPSCLHPRQSPCRQQRIEKDVPAHRPPMCCHTHARPVGGGNGSDMYRRVWNHNSISKTTLNNWKHRGFSVDWWWEGVTGL